MNIQEILKLYPNLSKHSDVWIQGIYNSICEEQVLKEFTEQTINSEKTIETLNKRYFGDFENAEDSYGDLRIEFITSQYQNIGKINSFMDSFGWFPMNIQGVGPYKDNSLKKILNTRNEVTILYGAKYDTKVEINTPLYHLAPDILYKHIQQRGLTPKTKSKISTHPERIYLLYPTTDSDYYDVALTLWTSLPESNAKNAIQDYYLLEVDTTKLSKHKFYNDPLFYMAEGAVWTYQNIPTSAIEVVKKFEVNPKPLIAENYETVNEWRNKFRNTI